MSKEEGEKVFLYGRKTLTKQLIILCVKIKAKISWHNLINGVTQCKQLFRVIFLEARSIGYPTWCIKALIVEN